MEQKIIVPKKINVSKWSNKNEKLRGKEDRRIKEGNERGILNGKQRRKDELEIYITRNEECERMKEKVTSRNIPMRKNDGEAMYVKERRISSACGRTRDKEQEKMKE